MEISWFFSVWRTSAILDLFSACLDYPRRVLGGLYRCATVGWNRCILSVFGTGPRGPLGRADRRWTKCNKGQQSNVCTCRYNFKTSRLSRERISLNLSSILPHPHHIILFHHQETTSNLGCIDEARLKHADGNRSRDEQKYCHHRSTFPQTRPTWSLLTTSVRSVPA